MDSLQSMILGPGKNCRLLTPGMTKLYFSRKPAAFRQALLKDSRLTGCRQALLERRFCMELASGAKVFVT